MTTRYEKALATPVAAHEEGVRYLRGYGMANQALRRLAADLNAHCIPYMLVGAAALNQHGYRRFTEDIDIILSADGLERFQRELVGKGYRPAFPGASRKFRETEHGVPVEILVSGEYPGDGKPKAIQFPDPTEQGIDIDGVRTSDLRTLIELKLASGMTGAGRLRDLADVQELIRVRGLDDSLADELHESVREKYLEIYRDLASSKTQYSAPDNER